MRVFFTVILFIYLCALLIGAMSPDVIKYMEGANDKLLHFLEFFILAILIFITLSAYQIKWKTLVTSVGSLILAVLSEIVQLAIKERSFSFLDLVADIGGIALGVVLCWVVIWIFFKQ